MKQSQPVRYEWLVFAICGTDAASTEIFQENLHAYVAKVLPWEFVFFTYSDEGRKYIGIMRRPVPE